MFGREEPELGPRSTATGRWTLTRLKSNSSYALIDKTQLLFPRRTPSPASPSLPLGKRLLSILQLHLSP